MPPPDDVLLLHAMLLMAGADGTIEGAEAATLDAFLNTLPEFRSADLDSQLVAARRLRTRYDSALAAVAALADITSPAVRRKAFVLAVDIALASGAIDDAETELLDAMQRTLGLDDATADQVIQVLAFKYAR